MLSSRRITPDGSKTYLSILVELVCGDIVDWEDDFDAFRFRLLHQLGDFLRARGVEEGVADLTQQEMIRDPKRDDVLREMLEP